jgi:hypothetical protein
MQGTNPSVEPARRPMEPIARMCRSIWWAFAASGVIGLVAAGAAALQLAPAPFIAGTWQLASGILILVASMRAPGGLPQALPFLGAAAGGIVLGAAGVFLPSPDPRIGLIGIGIWTVLACAGCLAVARFARAFGVPDGGLFRVSLIGIAAGAAISTLPAFGLGNAALAPVLALAVSGAVAIVASLRLRILPDEPPPSLSKREARRRQRTAG